MLFENFVAENYVNLNISETLSFVEISAQIVGSLRPAGERIVDELRRLSERDTFELILDANGNNIKLGALDAISVSQFFHSVDEFSGVEQCEISLQIIKSNQSSKLSVYFLDKFIGYLVTETASGLLDEFSKIFDGILTFEVQHHIAECRSSTIKFVGLGHIYGPELVSDFPRPEALSLLADNSTTANMSYSFLPNDFHFIVRPQNRELEKLFGSLVSMLCLEFLANFSKLSGNKFSYKVTGYKSVICDQIEINELAVHEKILYKIFYWAYGGGNNSDKVGLVRNVFSIHLDDVGQIKFDDEVWMAVQSNYQIYLRGNVEDYIEVKNKVGELIMEFSNKTYGFSDQILDSFKTNAFAILTFLLTVVVINGLKDSGEITIFSNAYLAIVALVSIVSIMWLFFMKADVLERFESSASSTSKILKGNYGKILLDSEIEATIDPVIELNRTYLKTQTKKYTKWWLWILAIFIIVFGICNRVFSVKNDIANQSGTHKAESMRNSAAIKPVVVIQKKFEKPAVDKNAEKSTVKTKSSSESKK